MMSSDEPIHYSKMFCILLVLLSLSSLGSTKVDLRQSATNKAFMDGLSVGDYEVVYPFQIREKNERTGIDTRNYYLKAAEHYQTITVVIRTELAGRLKLVLKRNNYIFLNQTSFRKLDSNGEHGLTNRVENCYYQGIVGGGGEDNSFVALSSCNGIRGIISFPNGTSYGIWPLDGGDRGRRHPHILYRTQWNADARCGAAMAMAAQSSHLRTTRQQHDEPLGASFHHLPKALRPHHKHRRHQRDLSKQTKYVEMAVIGDYEFMKSQGYREEEALTYMLESVNVADLMLSRELNIRLSVVYAEMWLDVQRIDLFEDIERTVAGVVDYSAGHIYHIGKDATAVFTGGSFANKESANALYKSICTARSAAIIKGPDSFSSQWSGQLLSQSMGHLLGLEHDTPSCQCDGGARCVMDSHPGSPGHPFAYQFSKCSVARMHGVWQDGQVHCLLNRPFQLSQLRECGNGVVDEGEECDCGSRDKCSDSCCDPLTCTLRAHAQCAAHHACCHRCELRKAGEVCRSSRSSCDVAEMCDGKSGDCPSDGHLIDGTACGQDGQCWRGNCSDPQAQCKQIWGRDAKLADMACFDQNSKGSEYANCGAGTDGGGRARACQPEDIRCGTLHCEGGLATPQMDAIRAFTFQFMHHDKQVQCKSIANTTIGLSLDGSSCGSGTVCVAGSCVEMTSVSAPVSCPSNNLALQCSGHGDCTTTSLCVCFAGWSGIACDVRTNSTLYKNRQDKKQVVVIPSIAMGKSLDTATLLGILLMVGVLMLLLLVCLLFCYRRRSVVEIPSSSDEKMDESLPDQTQRSIKFGNMPSYREEKRKHKSNKHIYGALNRITEAEERDTASLRSRDSGSQGVGSQLLFEPRAIPSSRSDVGVAPPCHDRHHDHIYAESAVGIGYRNDSPRRRRGDLRDPEDNYGLRSFGSWRDPVMSPSAGHDSPRHVHHVPSPLRLNINNYGQMLKKLQYDEDEDGLLDPDAIDRSHQAMTSLSGKQQQNPLNRFGDLDQPDEDDSQLHYPAPMHYSDRPFPLPYPSGGEEELSAVEADHDLGSNTESTRDYHESLGEHPAGATTRCDSSMTSPPASSNGGSGGGKFEFRQSPSLFSDPFKLEMSSSIHT